MERHHPRGSVFLRQLLPHTPSHLLCRRRHSHRCRPPSRHHPLGRRHRRRHAPSRLRPLRLPLPLVAALRLPSCHPLHRCGLQPAVRQTHRHAHRSRRTRRRPLPHRALHRHLPPRRGIRRQPCGRL